jgi:hypothetical protein
MSQVFLALDNLMSNLVPPLGGINDYCVHCLHYRRQWFNLGLLACRHYMQREIGCPIERLF